MENLDGFLNPAVRDNLRFVLSDEFRDESGEALVWEMRILRAAELLELRKRYAGRSQDEMMLAMAAASLVIPDMRDARLLAGLSDKEGRTVIDAADALKCMLTAPQLNALLSCYLNFQQVENFRELAEEAKN